MKYDLASLAKNKGARTYALFPRMDVPLAPELQYYKLLLQIVKAGADAVVDIVLPSYRVAKAMTTDADASTMEAVGRLTNATARLVNDQYREVAILQAKQHTKDWMGRAKRAFGVDLGAVVKDEDLAAYLELHAQRNAALIKNLAEDVTKRISQETLDSVIKGRGVKDLTQRLRDQLNITKSRAQLIARDQTSKLTSDLNKKRQTDAGVESYIWRTSMDERVRPRHRALEGNTYGWDEPTGAEEGLPPGQPIRCRCIAQGIVKFSADAVVKKAEVVEPGIEHDDIATKQWVKAA